MAPGNPGGRARREKDQRGVDDSAGAAYAVQSDTRITATLTVDRPDPARRVACRVLAQAPDFQPVAEQLVQVPASTYRVVNVEVDLTTLRRATTAVVKECSLI